MADERELFLPPFGHCSGTYRVGNISSKVPQVCKPLPVGHGLPLGEADTLLQVGPAHGSDLASRDDGSSDVHFFSLFFFSYFQVGWCGSMTDVALRCYGVCRFSLSLSLLSLFFFFFSLSRRPYLSLSLFVFSLSDSIRFLVSRKAHSILYPSGALLYLALLIRRVSPFFLSLF